MDVCSPRVLVVCETMVTWIHVGAAQADLWLLFTQ
jgi:hypothetical protein